MFFIGKISIMSDMRMIVLIILFQTVLGGQCTVQAGSSDSTLAERSILATAAGDGQTILKAAGHLFSAPARWGVSDWGFAAGTVAVTAGSSLLDTRAMDMMDRNRTAGVDRAEKVVVHYGAAGTMVALTGGTYVAGLIFHDRWIRETALLTGSALLVSGTVSTLCKMAVGRARPYMSLGNHYILPLTAKENFFSFPSGHTVVAFSVSTVLAERIGNPWASGVLYSMAGAVALSRLYTYDHWLSDVVFAAIVSTVISRSLVRWYEGDNGGAPTGHLRFSPGPYGIQLAWML